MFSKRQLPCIHNISKHDRPIWKETRYRFSLKMCDEKALRTRLMEDLYRVFLHRVKLIDEVFGSFGPGIAV
jgi:hypothetical protein